MNKIISFGLAGIFLAGMLTSIAHSQNPRVMAKVSVRPAPANNFAASIAEIHPAAVVVIKELKPAEINIKALRNFSRDHKDVPDAKWFLSSNGLFVATFNSDAKQALVFYNRKGLYEFSICYYKEEKLPADVRHLIKTRYYDFSIFQVTEVNRNNTTAFVVKMEDKSSWKTVKVVAGEIEVTEEYSKP